jgi:hypothetical protein
MAEDKKIAGHVLWHMDAGTFCDLWEEFVKRNAETEKERMEIVMEFANAGKFKAVNMTNRSKKQIIEDYKKHYNVLDKTEF